MRALFFCLLKVPERDGERESGRSSARSRDGRREAEGRRISTFLKRKCRRTRRTFSRNLKGGEGLLCKPRGEEVCRLPHPEIERGRKKGIEGGKGGPRQRRDERGQVGELAACPRRHGAAGVALSHFFAAFFRMRVWPASPKIRG